MTQNKNKIDRLHDQMPRIYQTRQNPNWKAVIEALGQSDQDLSDLIQEVRKQFFVKTAARPYLDRLGSNVIVSRPKFVGMDDPSFRKYIPVLAFQPKQVKLVLDLLLDIFFFKEATTSFIQSQLFQPFDLKDGWTLEYQVDGQFDELIKFTTSDFVDIDNATVDEVVSIINRQATNSFAVQFDNRIQKRQFIRIFSNTIGSKGSIEVLGGRANIGLQFQGFNLDAGSGVNTEWTVTKVGDTMTFDHTAGQSPNLGAVQVGDIAVIDLPGNEGSFEIIEVDAGLGLLKFVNLFGTAGVFDHSLLPDTSVNFLTPEKIVVFKADTRAVVWEVSPGEIIVEMPASPPVVRRSLIGSAHINGTVGEIIDRISDTSLEMDNAEDWPVNGGRFMIQQLEEIQTHIVTISEDTQLVKNFNTRFDNTQKFSYTSRAGNILSGITPNLPDVAGLFEPTLVSANRDTNNLVTATTSTAHNFRVGEIFTATDTVPAISGDPAINLTIPVDGTFTIEELISPTVFTYISTGDEGESSGGTARLERIGMANKGSLAFLSTSQTDTGILGPYMWDLNAPFVLSSLITNSQDEIKAGNSVKTLNISTPNNIPDEEGFVIFGFGTENEEGPIRYLFKPTDSTMQMDPAYVFENNHDVGANITVIRRRGAHIMSGRGTEYGAYITDPGVAREVLQDLMLQVKSVGIFIQFLIRFPEQLYATLDVYKSCDPDLLPINEEERTKCEVASIS